MDWDLVLIFSFIIVVTTVIGISVNGIVAKVVDYKRSQGASNPGHDSQRVGEIADRTDLIEDRLRVLERLATDRGQLLADEIEALRDRTLAGQSERENA